MDFETKADDGRPCEEEQPVVHVPDPLGFTACWLGGPVLADDAFAARVVELLRQLRALDPLFDELHWLGKSYADSPLLRDDLADVPGWVRNRASRGSWGYAVDLDNLEPGPSHLQIAISGGSAIGGGFTVQLPDAGLQTLGSRSGFRALVNAVRAAWPVHYAFTTTRGWHDAVNPWPASRDMLPIGGLTFSSKAAIGTALPHGVPHERFGTGTLIAITERPDRLDADDVQHALAARDALAAHGLLKLT